MNGLRDELQKAFENVAPMLGKRITFEDVREDFLNFRVSFRDGADRHVGNYRGELRVRANGSLVLLQADTGFDKALYQRGFGTAATAAGLCWLRSVSDHLDTRLEISACGPGAYAWAIQKLFDFDGKDPAIITHAFFGWIERQQKSGLLPADDGWVGVLKEQSEHWTRPEHFAQIDVPGVRLNLDGKGLFEDFIGEAHLGKAFMLLAPAHWPGVCYVHRADLRPFNAYVDESARRAERSQLETQWESDAGRSSRRTFVG